MINGLIYYSYIKKIILDKKKNLNNNVFIFIVKNNLNKKNILASLKFLFPGYNFKINSLIVKKKKKNSIVKKKKIYVSFFKKKKIIKF